MGFQYIDYRCEGEVAHVTLNRPEKHNAQSIALLGELDQILNDLASRYKQTKVVIIKGNGKSFSAGHDLDIGPERPVTSDGIWEHERQFYYNTSMKLWDLPQVTIAQVHGHCIAAGFMLALPCDILVASDDAKFSQPVVRKFGAAALECFFLPWFAGTKVAAEILFTGRTFSAAQFEKWGLVNHVVPRAELDGFVADLARDIQGCPPFAVRLVKNSMRRMSDMQGMRTFMDAHFDAHVLSHTTSEVQIGKAST